MQYVSAQQIAQKWGISKRRVQVLCTENRIKNAVRIGNMWAIPENAQKPTDARVHTTCASVHSSEREARTALKRLTTDSYQKIISKLHHPSTAKMVFVSLFATEIFCNLQSTELSGQKSDVYCMISSELLGRKRKTGQFLDYYSMFAFMFPDFRQYICRYSEYTDDILSWAYQYVNKISLDSGLESTQFFTERYMIAYLTNDIKNNSAFEHVYLDPACGGGNFLSYILERLYSLDTLSGLVKNITAIYTNPPFQTVRGMDEYLKEHLKAYFPDAKCDLCNVT